MLRGPPHLVTEHAGGEIEGGQLKLQLGAELTDHAGFAHAERGGQPSDGQALEAVDGCHVGCSAQDLVASEGSLDHGTTTSHDWNNTERSIAIFDRNLRNERETMTVVFVHGVPNTTAVWDPVRSLLPDRDTIALQLPGFGGDAPAGFSGTRYAYRDWLIDQLEAMNEPVDLVGHDQGSVISQGVILARPDLVNTWVLGGGVCADDFLWHRQARIWQTTGLGEQWRDQFLGLDLNTRAAMLTTAGVPETDAADVAAGMDRRMFDHILPLYRSEPYLEDWAFDPNSDVPAGTRALGSEDRYQSADFGSSAAVSRRGAVPRTRVRALVASRATRRSRRRADPSLVCQFNTRATETRRRTPLGRCRRRSVKRNDDGQRRPTPDWAVDVEMTAERVDAVLESDESRPTADNGTPDPGVATIRHRFPLSMAARTLTSDACECFAAFVRASATT